MDKYEQRRVALQQLASSLGHGGIAAIASRIDKQPSYVSRMLSDPGKPGRKRIGEDSWDELVAAYPQLAAAPPAAAPDAALTPDERAMLDLWRGLGADGKRSVQAVAHALAQPAVKRGKADGR